MLLYICGGMVVRLFPLPQQRSAFVVEEVCVCVNRRRSATVVFRSSPQEELVVVVVLYLEQQIVVRL